MHSDKLQLEGVNNCIFCEVPKILTRTRINLPGCSKLCWLMKEVVNIVGDFNAVLHQIPHTDEGIAGGCWIDLEQAYACDSWVAPASTCEVYLGCQHSY